MTIAHLFQELEITLSDICFSGLKNIQPALIQKLDGLKNQLAFLGMHTGRRRIEAFTAALSAYQLGESDVCKAADALCALEFYCRNVLAHKD